MLSILFPKPTRLDFYRDVIAFVAIQFVIAIVLFIISAVQLARLQVDAKTIVIRAFAIITSMLITFLFI